MYTIKPASRYDIVKLLTTSNRVKMVHISRGKKHMFTNKKSGIRIASDFSTITTSSLNSTFKILIEIIYN